MVSEMNLPEVRLHTGKVYSFFFQDEDFFQKSASTHIRVAPERKGQDVSGQVLQCQSCNPKSFIN